MLSLITSVLINPRLIGFSKTFIFKRAEVVTTLADFWCKSYVLITT